MDAHRVLYTAYTAAGVLQQVHCNGCTGTDALQRMNCSGFTTSDALQTLNVYGDLNKSIDSNPEHNYEVLLKSIKDVKDKCLPKKVLNITKRNTTNLNG